MTGASAGAAVVWWTSDIMDGDEKGMKS
jgi:hypothetical protein